jgi:hypothetical protein
MRLLTTTLTLAMLAILLISLASAQTTEKVSVKVVRLAGEVNVLRGGNDEPEKAELGCLLYAGDTLKVAKDAKAQLFFPPDTLVLLKENSVLKLSELQPDGRSGVGLTAGSLVANLQKALSPGATFEVETPNALAIVRGTVFEVEIQGEEKPTTNFYGYEGEVEVHFGEKILMLGPQVMLELAVGQAPIIGEHARELSEILRMFDAEYWEERAKDEVKNKIRSRLPF